MDLHATPNPEDAQNGTQSVSRSLWDHPELDEVFAILDEVIPILRRVDHHTYQMAYAQAIHSSIHSANVDRIDLAKLLAARAGPRYGGASERFKGAI